MKIINPITILAALLTTSASFAQTTPSGYTTQVLRPNRLNYVGINILPHSLAAGTITDIFSNGFVLQDSKANFNSLPQGQMFTVEITSGSATGSVREFVTPSNKKFTISAKINSLAVGDKYLIRKNPTVQEIFPNGAPLKGGATLPSTADIVKVPNGDGTFTSYWYKTSATDGAIGWWTTTDDQTRGELVTANIPLLYTDGIEVLRRSGVNVNLVLAGQVKTTSSSAYVINGDNSVSINPPVGATLVNSELQTRMQGHGTSPATADILWVPNPDMKLTGYWYKTSTTGGAIGWYKTSNGTSVGTLVTTDINLRAGSRIARKGDARFMNISVPSSYAGL